MLTYPLADVGEVNTLRLDVSCEDVWIVASVGQDPFTGDLHERGEAPILLQCGILTVVRIFLSQGTPSENDLSLPAINSGACRPPHSL